MSHPLQSLYDKIPKIACAGHCGNPNGHHCCGPIGCSSLEARLLDEYNGVPSPWISSSCGAVIMDIQKLAPTHNCPHLSPQGRCNVYEVRPMICRLWGVVEDLRCPWGCKVERYLSRKEATKLLSAADFFGS